MFPQESSSSPHVQYLTFLAHYLGNKEDSPMEVKLFMGWGMGTSKGDFGRVLKELIQKFCMRPF